VNKHGCYDGRVGGEPLVESDTRARQRDLRRSVASALSLLLVGLGLAFGGLDALVVRPAMTALARTGRAVIGTSMRMSGGIKGPPRRGPWSVVVQDSELGAQLVDGDGSADAGAPVALLCSTPFGRCERRALVDAYVARWPFTPAMIRAGVMLAVGLVAAALSRPARRPP